MSKITKIIARKIIDSRGNPTVEVDIESDNKVFGRAAAPSGASKGMFEVKDYPKNDIDFGIKNFNLNITNKLIGTDISDQRNFDTTLHDIDKTEDFSAIGGNIAIAASMAFAKLSAKSENIKLYRKLFGSKGKPIMP